MMPKNEVSIITNIDIIEKIKEIPDHIKVILSNAIAILIVICFALGVVLVIIGAIQWATGWDDRAGKKAIVKGVVLIGISLIAGSGIIAGYLTIT